jgi:fatty acid-binding protein DegV
MKIAIVTDSTSDIPDHLVQEYGIKVMPNIVVIEGQSLEDGKDISREEFYERLPTLERASYNGNSLVRFLPGTL